MQNKRRKSGERILLVDDNQEFLEESKETLILTGYETKIVSDSTKALDTACRVKPDIILLDPKMLKMNGFEVAAQLKDGSDTVDIPIIAMNGYFPVEKDSSLIDKSNMCPCVEKPFPATDIISQIEAVLDKKESVD